MLIPNKSAKPLTTVFDDRLKERNKIVHWPISIVQQSDVINFENGECPVSKILEMRRALLTGMSAFIRNKGAKTRGCMTYNWERTYVLPFRNMRMRSAGWKKKNRLDSATTDGEVTVVS